MAEIVFDYTPFPIHSPFHLTTSREKALIGAVGSGKTVALCADAILLGLNQPGSRILVARQTVPSLRDTTEHELLTLLSSIPEDRDGEQKTTLYDLCEFRRAGGHVDHLILPNGSEIMFRPLDDWRKLMSLNLAGIYVDEASETTAETYLGLMTRLRQQEPTAEAKRKGTRWKKSEVRHVMALATNPNGHDWIWEYFVHNPTATRRYFRSTSFDNPTLYDADGQPGAFLQSLMTMPEVWKRRYVWCEFDAFEGQILPFDVSTHVYPHFDPPADWERGMGLDWGLRSPVACGWWARDPKSGIWHKYREWQSYDPTVQEQRESYVTQDVNQIAARLKSIEQGEIIKWRAADPAIKHRQGSDAKSIEYWFRHNGFNFQMGAKEYSPRISALTELLHYKRLLVSSHCPMTQIAYQQYRWEQLRSSRDQDAPERPRKKDDHLVDADQYLATIFATGKAYQAPEAPITWDEELRDLIMKQVKSHKPRMHMPTIGPE